MRAAAPVSLHVRQRLLVSGKGDYQFAIGGPVVDVRAAPGSESEPGLASRPGPLGGVLAGRKVLAANVTLRAAPVAQFLPVRLRLGRDGDRVTLTVVNATRPSEVAYSGAARRPSWRALLDSARRASLSGSRLTAAFATFVGPVHARNGSAPRRRSGLQVELSVPGGAAGPVRAHARATADRSPSASRRADSGEPKVLLRVQPGARRAAARARRGPGPGRPRSGSAGFPAALLLRRLFEARMRLVRADQYQSFLADPDADRAEPRGLRLRDRRGGAGSGGGSPASTGGGSDVLLVVLVVAGSVVAAAGGLVVWAHS